MLVKYAERHPIDRFRCTEEIKEVNFNRIFEQGGLLYGYRDQFNVMSIDKDDIIAPKLKHDKAAFIRAYAASYDETKGKAEQVYADAKQSYIDLVIDGFKDNALKAFYED